MNKYLLFTTRMEDKNLQELGIEETEANYSPVLIDVSRIETAYPNIDKITDEDIVSITLASGDFYNLVINFEEFLSAIEYRKNS